MSVSKILRYQILRRDNFACRFCGRTAPDVELQVDHVIPEALGGPTEPPNLVTACADCNSGKAATPPDAAIVADVEASALRWTEAMKAARDRLHADRQHRDGIRQAFLDAWDTRRPPLPTRRSFALPDSWPKTIDQLAAAGLAVDDITDAVAIAVHAEQVNEVFRYFCGVAWRTARQLQETARTLLDSEGSTPTFSGLRDRNLLLACPHCHGDVVAELPFDAFAPRVVELPADPAYIEVVIEQARVKLDLDYDESSRYAFIAMNWETLVGPELAARLFPDHLHDGELLLFCDHPGWAERIRQHLLDVLIRNINHNAGEGTVSRIVIEVLP
ncbi:DciA family protein [Spongiactinospora sp. TRM90649]|uniref:DciA family protein n=1 Tax=Spongiactinospora sp. TRM90649 TaxID=3031114 RepID=UPI0023F99FF5|nr:DciA family protein [Spongiactinospora sp. TRM90649]MDF5758582.1 DciA family protein [Spongiactinospora sp. TRM90649]